MPDLCRAEREAEKSRRILGDINVSLHFSSSVHRPEMYKRKIRTGVICAVQTVCEGMLHSTNM